MPKLDYNIYGLDETSAATECSDAALSATALGRNVADNWGDIQDTTRAQSYANVGRESLGPSDPATPLLPKQQAAGNRDAEKLQLTPDIKSGAHPRGPRTSGDEGRAKHEPPKFDRKPGRSAGPIYRNKES